MLTIITTTTLLLQAEQLKITAEHFQGDEQKGISVFTGNVKIKKGRDELNASKVSIYIDTNRKPSKYVAQGDVSFFIKTDSNATYRGRSQKAVFLPQKKEYQFYKDVHLLQINEHKQIDGDEVVVNTELGQARAIGAKRK
ncbi:MAG TPA: lipopolysaccharide transport periplasmic protein LptA, partial [Helicobacteraceae bacterium]|nr:lipopolysaccharide transport periplasmic protein LptA [Helicobacteraceae bacterium]